MITSASEVVTDIKNLLDTAASTLTLQEVYEGDQQMLPKTPSVCVYAGNTERDYVGAPRYIGVVITVYIVVYHCVLTSNSVTEREANELAESIVTVVDSDETLNGKALDVLVTNIEPGEANKNNTWYRSSRLTVRITSRYSYGA
jgi:hypothetical protein